VAQGLNRARRRRPHRLKAHRQQGDDQGRRRAQDEGCRRQVSLQQPYLQEMVCRYGYVCQRQVRISGSQRIGRCDVWRMQVVGVVSDFHSKSMHSPIEPMFPCRWIYLTLILRISHDDIPETMRHIEEAGAEFVPNLPIHISFMDDRIDGMYRQEVLLSQLIEAFCSLAVLIAAIGLIDCRDSPIASSSAHCPSSCPGG
jgi:hypothetical protein